MTPNSSINSGLSPAVLLLVRKIRSVFNKLLPKENLRKNIKGKNTCKIPYTRRKHSFKEYRNGKETWKTGVIDKHIERLMYIIKDSKKTIERHHNQMKKSYLEDINNSKEEPMTVI